MNTWIQNYRCTKFPPGLAEACSIFKLTFLLFCLLLLFSWLQPEELEALHSHTFRVKTFKKAKHCSVCKQAIIQDGLICRGQSPALKFPYWDLSQHLVTGLKSYALRLSFFTVPDEPTLYSFVSSARPCGTSTRQRSCTACSTIPGEAFGQLPVTMIPLSVGKPRTAAAVGWTVRDSPWASFRLFWPLFGSFYS